MPGHAGIHLCSKSKPI